MTTGRHSGHQQKSDRESLIIFPAIYSPRMCSGRLTFGSLIPASILYKSEFGLALDEYINHAGLIYDAQKELGMIYRQYIDIAQKYNRLIMLTTPTRKVNAESQEKSTIMKEMSLRTAVNF